METDKTLSIEDKPADAKAVGDRLSIISEDLAVVQYGLVNLTPYDTSKVTVVAGTVEEPEYANEYIIKASGYGSATPKISYTLPDVPDIDATDIMYISFEIYVDAEASEYTSNLYQPKCFGHNFGNTPTTAKQWTKIQQRYTQGNTITAVGFYTGVTFVNTSIAIDKIIRIRNLVCVNLTKTYGTGNEPDIENINALVLASDGYFDKYNLFDAKQIADDVAILNSDMSDVWSDAFVNFTNEYIVANPTDKNDGSKYAAANNNITVSITPSVISAPAGDIIYIYGEFSPYSENDNCVSLTANNKSGRTGEVSSIVSQPQNEAWYPLSGRIVATETRKSITFTATWEQNSSIRIYGKHIIAINLTSVFGEYNEPTKEVLDRYFFAVSSVNGMDFSLANTKMFNLSSPSRKLVHPYGSYVMLDNDGNVKMGSVPDINWPGWQEIGTYGQNRGTVVPVYNKVHGTLETDGMMSVLPIYGCWSDEASSTGNPYHGGHVFHGWTADRQHRYTITQNIYRTDEAAVFNYIPGDKSGTNEGVFLRLRLGADNVGKGILVEPIYADPGYQSFLYTRVYVFGRLNIQSKPNGVDVTATGNTGGLPKNSIPASSSADGIIGDFTFDSNYAYFCVANNTWKRIPLETW